MNMGEDFGKTKINLKDTCISQQVRLKNVISTKIAYAGHMGESSNFSKAQTFENPTLKLVVCPLNIHSFKFKSSIVFRQNEN